MSRSVVWLIWCLLVSAFSAAAKEPMTLKILVVMWFYLALPLLTHWIFEKKQEPRP